jgi:hypothetical protein
MGKNGYWKDTMCLFEDKYVEAYPRGAGCFDGMQEAHLMHKLQRSIGVKCMRDNIDTSKGNGPQGDGMGHSKPKTGKSSGEDEEESEEEEDEAEEYEEAEEDEAEEEEEDEAEAEEDEAEEAEEAEEDEEEEGVVHAVDNSDEVWDRIEPLNIDTVLNSLKTCIKKDEETNASFLYKDFDDNRDHVGHSKEPYKQTFPACTRCNTLMTNVQKTTYLMITLGALEPTWFDNGRRSWSHRIRNYRYLLFMRKTVQQARDSTEDDDGESVFKDYELIELFQLLILCLASMTACAPTKDNAHEHFRLAGIRRLYVSAFMWSLCRIRWSRAFTIPFYAWHIFYAENMMLLQKCSWYQSVFDSCEQIQIKKSDKRISRRNLTRFIENSFVPAMLRCMDDSVKPSIWQLMYVCAENANKERLERMGYEILKAPHMYFFPHRYFHGWVRQIATVNIQRLDIDTWVGVLGKFIMLKRMVQNCVFNMPVICSHKLFERVAMPVNNSANIDGADAADELLDNGYVPEIKEGCIDSNILDMYQRFMVQYFSQILSLQHRYQNPEYIQQYDTDVLYDTAHMQQDLGELSSARRVQQAEPQLADARPAEPRPAEPQKPRRIRENTQRFVPDKGKKSRDSRKPLVDT